MEVFRVAARDVGLEDFARNRQLVEFPKLLGTIGDGGLIQEHLAAAKDGFGMAFPEACLFGYELCDGHAGVSHPEMSRHKSQALSHMVLRTLEGHGSVSGHIEWPYSWKPSDQRSGLFFPRVDGVLHFFRSRQKAIVRHCGRSYFVEFGMGGAAQFSSPPSLGRYL